MVDVNVNSSTSMDSVKVNVNSSDSPDPGTANEKGQFLTSLPDEIPILPLRNSVLFPYTVLAISVGQERSLQLLNSLTGETPLIGIVAYKNAKHEQPGPKQLYQTGCIAQILRTRKDEETGHTDLLLQGLDKIHIENWTAEDPFLKAKIKKTIDIEPGEDDIEAEAVRKNLEQLFEKLVSIISYLPKQLLHSVSETQEYRQFAYLISSSIRIDVKEAQSILEQEYVLEKMLQLTELVNHEIEVFELGKKIQSEAQLEMEKSQRDYILRQQLKAIKKELGEEGDAQIKIEEYQKKIEQCGMSEEAVKKANIELERLERMPEASAEYNTILTYLDWLTSLPWNQSTEDKLDINEARKILDEDHYGLEKIKTRILEYLAVRQLRQQRQTELETEAGDQGTTTRRQREGVILCLVGPPGIGKTSLGHSIARAIGRKLQRISLGGVRDEAEIRGHRKTYVGAMPGRFITALRDVGTNNPVILLDEVDKLGSDWRGDPSAALLEVLDPEQNRDFRDHYLDVAFDLSQLLFIATANVADNIPGPLMDRMETLHLSGYTDDEKLNIAKKYLLPRQKTENALRVNELDISEPALLKIIRDYTREAGVRSLDRRLGTICRKVAIKLAEKDPMRLPIEEEHIEELLGKAMFYYDVAERTKMPGIATGLGVTAVGGDILFIEVSSMQGKGKLTITGQLGEVMSESVQAALSYVRTQATDLGIDPKVFEQTDIHVHIPAGAIPKDGPSAGVTLVVALVSLLTDKPVKMDVGMTGEISLRGMVLPVGGIKDKVLAAQRAHLKTVILPKRNEKDLDDLPESTLKSMKFVLVTSIEEALEVAL